MNEFTGQIPFFYNSFLSQFATALPKTPLWAVAFDDIPVSAISSAIKEEPRAWGVEAKLQRIAQNADALKTKGCLFANTVQFPGENLVVNPSGIQKNQFIRSNYADGRDISGAGLQIQFLETNDSIIENIMRPWVVATGRYGLVAREGALNYRTNFTAWKFNSGVPQGPMYILQQYKFFGVAPVTVPEVELVYTPSVAILKSVSFTYHYYEIL